MKKIILTLTAIFICTIAYAHTINWHVGNTILETTTCDSGESVTPPTAPYKYGYHFVKWKLPYTQIEYLESTGTQYIDTGVIANIEDIKIESKAIKETLYSLFGIKLGTSFRFSFTGAGNNGYLLCGTTTVHYGEYTPNTPLIPHLFIVDNCALSVDGELKTPVATDATGNIGLSIFLFARNFDGSKDDAGKHKIYYFKIWIKNILIRDFIPVLDLDGVPCMYDRVEKKFYYNQGTGQFIAGPVIGE